MKKGKVLKFIFLSLLIVILLTTSSCKNENSQEHQEEVSTIAVDAQAAIVMEKTTNRIIYEQNIHQRLLPASITKILTTMTVLEHFDINQNILISFEMINVEGSKIYLEVNDLISVKDLLYGLMLNSGNDAANALAIGLTGSVKNFVHLMNDLARKIGMTNSSFENPHGLDRDSKNYTTAKDMALLMCYCLKNETFRNITSCKNYNPIITSQRQLYFHNKHRLIQNNPQVTGGKTGYTKAAGRTLVTSFTDDELEIVIVTLNCSNDWSIHQQLAKQTFDHYSSTQIISTFGALMSLLPYGDFYLTSQDLYIPLAKWENPQEVEVTFIINNNDLVIKYTLNDTVIAQNYLCNRKKD